MQLGLPCNPNTNFRATFKLVSLQPFMRRINYLLVVCSIHWGVWGQALAPISPLRDSLQGFYIRTGFNYGTIIQHHSDIAGLVKGFIYGTELNFCKPADGSKVSDAENNYPEKGFGASYFNLDNPAQLGNIYAAYIFCDIPLSKKKKPFRLYWRLSPGLGYATNYFNALNNHKNDLISSPLNAYVNFRWFYRWNLTKRLRWDLGINFSHASNGHFTVPNLGANLATLNTGFSYNFSKKSQPRPLKTDSGSHAIAKYEVLIWGAIGFEQTDVLGKEFMDQTYNATFYLNKRNTHKFGLGIDAYYSAANYEQMLSESNPPQNVFQNLQAGAKFSYCYNIGRVSLPVEMGYYFLSRYHDDGHFFHRIGIRYNFKNNVVAIISLKTHWAVASYFEYGLGYRFPVKKKL